MKKRLRKKPIPPIPKALRKRMARLIEEEGAWYGENQRRPMGGKAVQVAFNLLADRIRHAP